MAFPKVVIERDDDSEESSSDEEEEEEDPETVEEEGGVEGSVKTEKIEVDSDAKRKGKAPITISLKKVCKVSVRKFHFFPSPRVLFWVIVIVVPIFLFF